MVKKVLILFIFSVFIPGHFLSGQNHPDMSYMLKDSLLLLNSQLKELDLWNQNMNSRLDSLVSDIKKKEEQAKKKDELQKLLEEANQLSMQEKMEKEDITKKFQSGIRQQQGLNPNISLGGDFFAATSTSKHQFITDAGEVSYGNNGFFLREMELAFEAPLDPFTRGKTFFSVSKEGISIEEAYMEWLNLPLKMNLKIGIFYSEFGPLNRYHDHALPQFDRPGALVYFFSNNGLQGTGLSATFMLPQMFFSDASFFDLAVVRGGSAGDRFSFADRSMLFIGQVKNFYDISRNSYFEIRLSDVTGKNPAQDDHLSSVGSLGLTYKWVPVGREKYRTVDWKSEFLYSYRRENAATIRSKGFYSTVQNKMGARFWMGGRVGYSELPFDNRQNEWDFSINLDFWQSEFVFTRIQYQYNHRNINSFNLDSSEMLPDDHSIIIQVCWAMGPHKHEAY